MGIKTVCICDRCERPIDSSTEKEIKGYIIRGNIYVADIETRGGLIGNNFPNKDKFSITEVKENIYCKECFIRILCIT